MSGGARVVNRMPAFVDRVQARAARSMTQALIIGAGDAAAITPIASSNLVNSQYSHVRLEGDKIVGTCGYTAEYATYVHDPEVKQRFRLASAEKEFLRKGFERAAPKIRAVITGAIKT